MTLSPAWDGASTEMRLSAIREWADGLDGENRRRVEWLTDEYADDCERECLRAAARVVDATKGAA